jgi:hypothetical protein
MRRVTLCAVLIVGVGLAGGGRHVAAQSPVVNARAETVQAAGGLAATLRQVIDRGTAPLWVAWQEPAEGRSVSCCWDSSGCEGCRLEPRPAGAVPAAMPERTLPLPLEGDSQLVILVRVEDGRIDRVRTVGASCPLDAGGLPFVTVNAVPAAESLAWLRALVDTTAPAQPRRLADSAIHAMARHADPATVPMLLELARHHAEPRVRGGALVALAQTAGRRVAPDLTGAIDNDPDTEVKKKAVFAVSQLPKDEAVPLLIKIAREHKNNDVRRQAMFWLGQSKDPRALDFFAAILKD